MRAYERDEERGTARAGQGHEQEHAALLYKAAAAGRVEVLGRSGVSSLQRAAGNGAVGAMLAEEKEEQAAPRSSVHDVVGSGGGEPMDADTRTDMESRLGSDFGDVRIHTDGRAHDSAADVGAHAYTVGSDVVFQRGKYDPSSHEGKTMLAHELTHVVQQRSGPVEGTETAGGIRVSDPSDRFEREAVANADRVMAAPTPAPAPSPAAPAPAVQRAADGGAGVVQREEDEDEEPADVQGAFVQRAAEEEEEEPAE